MAYADDAGIFITKERTELSGLHCFLLRNKNMSYSTSRMHNLVNDEDWLPPEQKIAKRFNICKKWYRSSYFDQCLPD